MDGTPLCDLDQDVESEEEIAFEAVTVLMPNGLIIELNVDKGISLKDLKREALEAAEKEPLHGLLRQDPSYYSFVRVSEETGEPEELRDENCTLFEVKPYLSILKLAERSESTDETFLSAQIGGLIGKGMHEFDAMKNSEVNDCRYRLSLMAEEYSQVTDSLDWRQRLQYIYPERLHRIERLPSFIQKKIPNNIMSLETTHGKWCHSLKLNIKSTVNEAIAYAHQLMGRSSLGSDQFVLKVVGREEYLIGENFLRDYVYVQECLTNNIVPSFLIVPVAKLIEKNISQFSVEKKFRKQIPDMPVRRNSFPLILAESITRKFSITIDSVSSLDTNEGAILFMKVGLFHGVEQLSPVEKTEDRICELISEGNIRVVFNQPIFFNIVVKNLTQVTRICFALFERRNNKFIQLSWLNLPVYDYRYRLRQGSVIVPMWTQTSNLEQKEDLNYLGSNYPVLSAEDAPLLTLTIAKVVEADNYVSYSGQQSYLQSPEVHFQPSPTSPRMNPTRQSPVAGSKHHMSQLKQIFEKTPINDFVEEQDKELFRLMRNDCLLSLPRALPHILACVRWQDRTDVLAMKALLHKWPLLEPEDALCLFTPRFASLEVRRFAIRCFDKMTDETLSLYLLQLTQALRNETFLFNDLGQFLLRRALANQIIGHKFFWLLRSEMHDPAVTVCFGLFLEAYCRGAQDHIPVLSQQVEALKKLSCVTELMRQDAVTKNENKENQLKYLQKVLSFHKNSFINLRCTLEPRIIFGSLKTEKCKAMDSKMKPLWLVFSRQDVGAEDILIIFKNGDDLRQDMLIVQLIKVMDKVWKEEGLDLRLIPYGCVSTDCRVGLIEVVKNAQTIASVQKEKSGSKATSSFNEKCLFLWLKDYNPDEESLSAAIEEFTHSCAGYCVLTYILGIADRHSDNIMIKKNGQLFHIDFGHVLGTFKEWYGISRERVPFVLTPDFLYVIKQGSAKNEKLFRLYCEQAYMAIRRKGHLIVTLFSLMLTSGIPEITSSRLQYLNETLVLQKSEREAKEHFSSMYDIAVDKSRTVQLNWMVHNMARDNK